MYKRGALKKFRRSRYTKRRGFTTSRSRLRPGYNRKKGFYGRYNSRREGRTPELKFKDVQVTTANFGIGNGGQEFYGEDFFGVTAGAAGDDEIMKIKQGVQQDQRIGRMCTIKAIQWKGAVTLNTQGSLLNSSEVTRIMVILDTQANGESHTLAQVLKVRTGNNLVYGYRNLENSGRFKMLWDKSIKQSTGAVSTNAADATTSAEVVTRFQYYKRVHIPINYNSTTGAITELKNNRISFWAVNHFGLTKLEGILRIRFEG